MHTSRNHDIAEDSAKIVRLLRLVATPSKVGSPLTWCDRSGLHE